MFNKTALDEFLVNDKINHYLYVDKQYSYESKYFYKEKYNDRFYLLYSKRYEPNRMDDREYDFEGYYDCIEKVVYNSKYGVDKMLVGSKIVKMSSFGELLSRIENDIEKIMNDYCIENNEILRKEAKDEFDNQGEYYLDNYKDNVDRRFVANEIDEYIDLPSFDARNKYETEFKVGDKLIYNDYLNNPVDTILKITKWMQKDEKIRKEIGMTILKNDYQNEYLKEILENKNNKYNNLYLNRKILNSIKNIDAVNLNITIDYSGNTLTFKYPKSTLVNDLERCEKTSDMYGKAYDVVKDFLEKYKESNDTWRNHSFDFENISYITYGKNALYEKEIQKEKNKVEIEMEEIDI